MPLAIPRPSLTGVAAGGRYKQPQPIEIACGPVFLPGGPPLALANAARFGFLVYREIPGALDVWDQGAKRWRDAASVDPASLEPKLMTPKPDGSWTGTLVPIGEKDALGADVFLVDAGGGQPLYRIRCTFASRTPAEDGLSPASDAILLTDLDGDYRVGLASTPKKPEDARQIVMFARDAALNTVATVTLFSEDTGRRVELEAMTAAGVARIVIRPDGAIRLEPAGTMRVIVAADLEVEKVFYRPFGGGARQWLP